MKHAVNDAVMSGYRPVVLNHKGSEGMPMTIPELYSASFTDDLRCALQHIK